MSWPQFQPPVDQVPATGRNRCRSHGTQWLLWPPGVNVRSGICMGTGISPEVGFHHGVWPALRRDGSLFWGEIKFYVKHPEIGKRSFPTVYARGRILPLWHRRFGMRLNAQTLFCLLICERCPHSLSSCLSVPSAWSSHDEHKTMNDSKFLFLHW